MSKAILAVSLAFVAAMPARATGGLMCRTAGPHPIEIHLVIGHTAVSSVVQARLFDDARAVPVTVAQSWLEPNQLRLDLTDPNAERHELRLRARSNEEFYDGSLWRNGERRWVRCREG